MEIVADIYLVQFDLHNQGLSAIGFYNLIVDARPRILETQIFCHIYSQIPTRGGRWEMKEIFVNKH